MKVFHYKRRKTAKTGLSFSDKTNMHARGSGGRIQNHVGHAIRFITKDHISENILKCKKNKKQTI